MDFQSLGQQAKEYLIHGQSREAINLLESQLSVHKEETDSEDYKKTMSELCEIYNDLASELLSSGDHPGALALLRKAEGINIGPGCKVKTLNTLACYYRQIGKARIAENYLVKALALQADYPNTHLNLCAVLSELGKHEDAMMEAMQAVVLMQDLLISFRKNPQVQVDDSFMPIAFLNLGVQLEFLKRFEEAFGFYRRAESFAEKKLHPEHPVRKNAENAVREMKKKLDERKETSKSHSNSANSASGRTKLKNEDFKGKATKGKETNKVSAKKPDVDKNKLSDKRKAENDKKEIKKDQKIERNQVKSEKVENEDSKNEVLKNNEERKSFSKKEIVVDSIDPETSKNDLSGVEGDDQEVAKGNHEKAKEVTIKEKDPDYHIEGLEKRNSGSLKEED